MNGKPLYKVRYCQGRADSNSPSRSGLCPAIIMCQTNTTVSLHAACHSTASSLNEWEASLQPQVPPRQGRQQQPFQVWTLSCYHHVPNQHHSITACTCSMSQHCSLNEWEASLQTQVLAGQTATAFQVWTLSCYHHVPNQHHSITACSMSQHCKLIK